VVIPPTLWSIACNAFPYSCPISVFGCNSCPELEQWCARRNRDSLVDFRRVLRLGSELPSLLDCLIDLSMFERSQSVGVANENQCELYRRLSDDLEIVVKLIHHFDIESNSESVNQLEIQNEIEKLMNLKHPCVATPFGFVVSSRWTELKLVRAYSSIGSLETVLQRSPSWWAMTAKSIAVVWIVLGMRFVHSFGLVCMNLKPSNILFSESHQIQIVDIIPNQTESHCRETFDERTQ
jgi:hypothetical protein